MKLDEFDYVLPEELIAQHPPERREQSRLLVMKRADGSCRIHPFSAIVDYLRQGDCLVVNDTRVIPSRLFGHRSGSGGKVEILLVEELRPGVWEAMMRPGRRLHPGETVVLAGEPEERVSILGRTESGTFQIAFAADDPWAVIERCGRLPLPPYIRRLATDADASRYQTVYAAVPGAVAAPTAGLHFTPEILAQLASQGIRQASVTLHVGIGTFRPVQVDNVDDHVMHEERYVMTPATAGLVNQTRAEGGRVVAVGTTSVRVLETCWNGATGQVEPGGGRTRLFLRPPARPQAVDALLTNFHLPKSTLLMLVSTFSSLDKVQAAYRLAIRERLRFFSYGDCMLLI